MSRISFILLVVGVLLGTTAAEEHKCPKNQEWTKCGTMCPLTCNTEPLDICARGCVVGCQCKWGFLLNAKGECVLPAEC